MQCGRVISQYCIINHLRTRKTLHSTLNHRLYVRLGFNQYRPLAFVHRAPIAAIARVTPFAQVHPNSHTHKHRNIIILMLTNALNMCTNPQPWCILQSCAVQMFYSHSHHTPQQNCTQQQLRKRERRHN